MKNIIDTIRAIIDALPVIFQLIFDSEARREFENWDSYKD